MATPDGRGAAGITTTSIITAIKQHRFIGAVMKQENAPYPLQKKNGGLYGAE